MSTTFTDNIAADAANIPLGQALISANQWVSASLLHVMRARNHDDLTSAHLTFFCHLNCGATSASEVARRMGITRQAVYKVTQELQRIGALELIEDPTDKRQKIIHMTKHGERIAMDAVAAMEEVEAHLRNAIGQKRFESLAQIMRLDWGAPLSSTTESEA